MMSTIARDEIVAPVIIVTHKTSRADLDHALAAMAKTDVVIEEPVALRIETV